MNINNIKTNCKRSSNIIIKLQHVSENSNIDYFQIPCYSICI